MARFVLKNNFFEFDSKIKQQISGTTTGTKFAPPYAGVFMDKFETDFLTTKNVKSWVWKLNPGIETLIYIDDIFCAWTHGDEKLNDFLCCLNRFHPNLKFTYEYSTERINFLDVIVTKEKDRFVAYVYCKATGCHQYVHYDSCHSDHMKKLSI